MSGPSTQLTTKFTDSSLKWFYGNILEHYQTFKKKNPNATIQEAYNELYIGAYCTLSVGQGPLSNLTDSERIKAYSAFETIFKALPHNEFQKNRLNASKLQLQVPSSEQIIVLYKQKKYYTYRDSLLIDWMIINSLTHNCYYSNTRVYNYPSGNGAGTTHTHPNSNDNKSKDGLGQVLAILALIALAAAAAIGTFLALFYMFDQFIHSIDRLVYNEGWLKAALMLANSVAFGSLSTLVTLTLLSTPLIALAVTAGLNPVGVVVVASVCLTIMGAGIGAFVMNLCYDFFDKKANPDAMDPSDTTRFRLTSSEEQALIKKGIDPLKVKCAMVALRAEMSKVMESETLPSSYLGFLFSKGKKSDFMPLLEKIRKLRSGSLEEVAVGDLTFDCKMDYQSSNYHQYEQEQYNTDYDLFSQHKYN